MPGLAPGRGRHPRFFLDPAQLLADIKADEKEVGEICQRSPLVAVAFLGPHGAWYSFCMLLLSQDCRWLEELQLTALVVNADRGIDMASLFIYCAHTPKNLK